MADVLVVVPTTGRPCVREAVDSVLAQTHTHLRLVVVADGASPGVVRGLLPRDDRLAVLATHAPHTGGNAARMLPLRTATEPYVAFLDDDDLWTDDKLSRQLFLARNAAVAQVRGRVPARHVVVSSRLAVLDEAGAATGTVLPRRLLSEGDDVLAYLFDRREVRFGEALLHTSTLLCDRALLERTPWREGLVRHQDWDWLLAVGRDPQVRVEMVDEVLVGVRSSRWSLSHTGAWHDSLAWAQSHRAELGERRYADFLLAHTLPLAVRTRGRGAALRVLGHALRTAQLGLPALAFALLSLLVPDPRPPSRRRSGRAEVGWPLTALRTRSRT